MARGEILVLFPEGSRGEPEQLTDVQARYALLVKEPPEVPVIPVFMHGLGKALPKGTGCSCRSFRAIFIVGEPLYGKEFLRRNSLPSSKTRLTSLAAEEKLPAWE